MSKIKMNLKKWWMMDKEILKYQGMILFLNEQLITLDAATMNENVFEAMNKGAD